MAADDNRSIYNVTVYSNFTRLIPIVTAVRFVIVDFKEMNESSSQFWSICVTCQMLTQPTV